MKKNLILISASVPPGLAQEVAADRYPRTDFMELSKRLNADVLSFEDVKNATGIVGIAKKIFGPSVALAVEGLNRRKNFDLVFTASEAIGMPLAALFKATGTHRKHLMIAHRLSPPKKALLWKLFGLQTEMSTVFVYCGPQKETVIRELSTPADKVLQIPFMADEEFFRPMPEVPEKNQVCSVGLEWRDYPTLMEAAKDLTCEIKIAAGSLWSKCENEAENSAPPSNVDVRSYKYPELRQLYAQSKVVVIPLYQTDFQAGITSILEAMAMAKPVVVTKTVGQTDTIVDGETGLYTAPGDATDLRDKIQFLLQNESERKRLGGNAFRAFRNAFTLNHLAARIGDRAESLS
jgi:glycosyltransferase involved in cell wall biosynthesis